MKNSLILIVVLLLSFQAAQAQTASVPSSKIIDAAQMLRDLKTLSADDMQGRLVGSPASAKAREYILGRFKQSGLQAFGSSYLQPFDFTNRAGKKIEGANVVGYIKGKKNPDKYIVVTAHYDHLGVRNGQIYNGADDNASGTSALFAIAKYFSKNPPANSIIFAALDAEEGGGDGGKKLVAEPPVKKESLVMNVNMDMVAHNDVNELYATGPFHYPFLKPYLETVAKTAPVKLMFGHEGPTVSPSDDWTTQSDHHAFHQAKIPFIYFGVEDHKDYHKATDDFENINQTFYVHAVETILEAIKKFDANLAQIEKQKTTLTKN
jgi:Zn-dependent M28 family amino/carboxypeptidase